MRVVEGPNETRRIALALKGALNGAGLTGDELKRIVDDPELAGAVASAVRDFIRNAPSPKAREEDDFPVSHADVDGLGESKPEPHGFRRDMPHVHLRDATGYP